MTGWRVAGRVVQAASAAALAGACVLAARQVARVHEGWALDALGWAALLMVVQVAAMAAGWGALGRGWWTGLGRGAAVRSFVAGWAARYVPGPPTGPAGKLVVLRASGMPAERVVAMLWVDQAAQLAAAVAVPSLLALSAAEGPWRWLAPAGTGAAGAIMVLATRPRLVRRLSRWPGRGLTPGTAPAPAATWTAFAAYLLGGLLAAAAFHVTAVVVSPWPGGRWDDAMLAFSVASLAGFLTPFAPSGAGVRETVIVALLGGELGATEALTVAVVARATAVAVDGALLAGYWLTVRLPTGRFARARRATASNRRW